MPDVLNREINFFRPVSVLLFFLISSSVFTQVVQKQDTILKISRGSVLHIQNARSFIPNDTAIVISPSLVQVPQLGNNNTLLFYDSLKAKASRTRLTKALFDLVVISPGTTDSKKINERSDEDFRKYSGIKIRNIQIRRLNVFGADISNPGYYEPNRIEKILNSAHVNTRENIIRKYLIIHEGDTLSPLKLTDNERILRQLPFLDDARIIVVPVSTEEADILIITKDLYSLGADFTYRGKNKGSIWVFDKNIFGTGHEFRLEVPYSSTNNNSPGIGLDYYIKNISKSFIDLNLNYYSGLGKKTYGISISRQLISSETKYAGGIAIREMFTSEDLDTLPKPSPLKYNYQDYWLQRSFMIDRKSVTRFIAGIRYLNNNVFEKPDIQADTYYSLQKFRLYLGSLAISKQKYYKTNLIYNYGRTEDIPYGFLVRLTAGLEQNEFKERLYLGLDSEFGGSIENLGYFHLATGLGTFKRGTNTEQGVFSVNLLYFSNLLSLGNQRIRNFINIDYIRGFDRYEDEYLTILRDNGFTGFSNDSIRGAQRVDLSLESVIFNPVNFYGFRFAIFGFADMSFLSGTNEQISNGTILTALGLGIRIRNNNLVFRTFQIRLGFFPSPPMYSKINHLTISGEQLLHPENFDPGPPSLIPYR